MLSKTKPISMLNVELEERSVSYVSVISTPDIGLKALIRREGIP